MTAHPRMLVNLSEAEHILQCIPGLRSLHSLTRGYGWVSLYEAPYACNLRMAIGHRMPTVPWHTCRWSQHRRRVTVPWHTCQWSLHRRWVTVPWHTCQWSQHRRRVTVPGPTCQQRCLYISPEGVDLSITPVWASEARTDWGHQMPLTSQPRRG